MQMFKRDVNCWLTFCGLRLFRHRSGHHPFPSPTPMNSLSLTQDHLTLAIPYRTPNKGALR